MIAAKQTPALLLISLTIALVGCINDRSQDYAVLANDGIYSAAINESGKIAIIGSMNNGASLWDNQSKNRLFKWHHNPEQDEAIHLVSITDNGELAATVSNNTSISIWNASHGFHIRSFLAPSKINQLALLNQNNAMIIALENHTSLMIDIPSGSTLAVFNHKGRVNSVDLNANTNIAITGSDDHSAKIWNLSKPLHSKRLAHNGPVNLVKLSPDGSLALTVARYDKVIVWDTNNASLFGEIPLSKSHLKRGVVFTAAKFSNDNRWLLTGTTGGVVQLWDLVAFKLQQQWTMPKRYFIKPNQSTVLAVAFTSKGHYSAITTNGLFHQFKYAMAASIMPP